MLDDVTQQWLLIRRRADVVYARDRVEFDIQSLFEPGAIFAKWAAQTVDAFSADAFPEYCRVPPDLESIEGIPFRQKWLTGTDDTVQSGLRIILWAAACQNPQLLLLPAESEWSHHANLRWSIRKWAGYLVIEMKGSFIVDPLPMDWVRAAFDDLTKTLDGGPEIQGGSPTEDLSAYQPASVLLTLLSEYFKGYRQLNKFLERHPDIRTLRPRKQRHSIHAGDLVRALQDENEIRFKQLGELDLAGAMSDGARIHQPRRTNGKDPAK